MTTCFRPSAGHYALELARGPGTQVATGGGASAAALSADRPNGGGAVTRTPSGARRATERLYSVFRAYRYS
jgi:hypothetical protein